MKVILQETMDGVGHLGDLLDVKDGYARNFLLPRKKAVLADSRSIKAFEHIKRVAGERAKKEKLEIETHAKSISAVSLTVQAQVGKALSYAIAGNQAAGLALLQQTAQQLESHGVTDAEGVYKVAQAFAVLGDQTTALKLWRRSVEGGFFCYPYFANDPLLNNLRGEADHARLLEMARRRHEGFKQRFF